MEQCLSERTALAADLAAEDEGSDIDVKESRPCTNLAFRLHQQIQDGSAIPVTEEDLGAESDTVSGAEGEQDKLSSKSSCEDEDMEPLIALDKINCKVKDPDSPKDINDAMAFYNRYNVSVGVVQTMEIRYQALLNSKSKSLLKKYLTEELFEKLKTQTTSSHKCNLLDCIQSGLKNFDSVVGAYAGDADCYSNFRELFEPIIAEYHFGLKSLEGVQQKLHFGDYLALKPIFSENVIKCSISCSRNLQGMPFSTTMSKKHFRIVQSDLKFLVQGFTEDYAGSYKLLKDITSKEYDLFDLHKTFRRYDRFLRDAKILRFWPRARGVFFNKNNNFAICCNGEDHLKVISVQADGNVPRAYKRLVNIIDKVEDFLCFSISRQLGFLTCSPKNVGTGLRITFRVNLPYLATRRGYLRTWAHKHNMKIQRARKDKDEKNEDSNETSAIFDISNTQCLGLCEFDLVKHVATNVSKLLEMEKAKTTKAPMK